MKLPLNSTVTLPQANPPLSDNFVGGLRVSTGYME